MSAKISTALTLGALMLVGAMKQARDVKTGSAAFTDYTGEQPGTFRRITVADLPRPFATKSVTNHPKLVHRSADMVPQCLPGFSVSLFAEGLEAPRLIRTAPNGDFFVSEATAENGVNKILVFRGIDSKGKPEQAGVFAEGLKQPFGIAFYPPGPNPRYLYVANTDSVIRFP